MKHVIGGRGSCCERVAVAEYSFCGAAAGAAAHGGGMCESVSSCVLQ